jgi:hypothetical protein
MEDIFGFGEKREPPVDSENTSTVFTGGVISGFSRIQ